MPPCFSSPAHNVRLQDCTFGSLFNTLAIIFQSTLKLINNFTAMLTFAKTCERLYGFYFTEAVTGETGADIEASDFHVVASSLLTNSALVWQKPC